MVEERLILDVEKIFVDTKEAIDLNEIVKRMDREYEVSELKADYTNSIFSKMDWL